MRRVTWAVVIATALVGCGDDEECAAKIEGRRYDAERQCVREPEVFGCLREDALCPQLQAFATDGEGNCVQFPNLCLPPGYTVDRGEQCPQGVVPVCSEMGKESSHHLTLALSWKERGSSAPRESARAMTVPQHGRSACGRTGAPAKGMP